MPLRRMQSGCWPGGRRTRDDRRPRWWREREFARRQRHPERQLTRVYSLVNGQGSGRRLASAGRGDSSTVELFPGNCGRIARGCRLGRQGNRGSCRARPRYLAGGGITGGVAQRAPGPPPPRPVPALAIRPTGATRWGTMTSRRGVPTTSTETSRILWATEHWGPTP